MLQNFYFVLMTHQRIGSSSRIFYLNLWTSGLLGPAASWCLILSQKCWKAVLVQWRNSYYRTFYGPILCFLVTFYFINTKKFDQKAEYGTKKCLIVRISPLYHGKISKRYPIFLNYWIMAEKTSLPSLFQIQTKNSNKSFNFEGRRFSFCIQIAYLIGDISYFYSWAFRLTILELSEKYFSSIFSLGHIMSKFGLFWTKWVLSWWKEISFSQIYQKLLVWDLSSKKTYLTNHSSC